MAAVGLWGTVSPKVPRKVSIYFVYIKKQSLRLKYGKNITAIVLFNLTVNLAPVKFTSVNLNLFYEIKPRKLNKNKHIYAGLT